MVRGDAFIQRATGQVVAEPGTEAELVVEQGYSSVTLLVPPSELIGHLNALGREHEFTMPNGVECRSVGEPGTRPLFLLGQKLADRTVSGQSMVSP